MHWEKKHGSEVNRRDFLKVLGQGMGALLLGVWGVNPLSKGINNKPTLIPWPSTTESLGSKDKPHPTNTPTLTPTKKPTNTPYPTCTTRPTHTKTPTDTPVPTRTPDRRAFIIPTPENFEQVAGLLAISINYANCIQRGKPNIDPSDLTEDYNNFSRYKYEQYKRGERPYKYLTMEEYRKKLDNEAITYVKATVRIPEIDDHFTSEKRYFQDVLNHLHDDLEVDISQLNEQQRYFIARDIAEFSQRFTCIKFLRFVWGLFGDYDMTGKGIFPQVYQARIKNAGELAYQIISGGGRSIFAAENTSSIRQSLIRNANAISEHPENRPEFFDNKIMVFFRSPVYESESGHVGVGKLIAEYDSDDHFKRFVITYIDVDGYTGQAHYAFRIDLDEFRKILYSDKSKENGGSRRYIGWLYNRQ